jgi:hypothetical protein
MRLLKEACP